MTVSGAFDGHVSAGLTDVVLIKYDPLGNKIWSRQIGTSASDNEYGIIYSPYILGLESEAVGPVNFSSRVGVLSRYAITSSLLGTGRYYRLTNYINLKNATQV